MSGIAPPCTGGIWRRIWRGAEGSYPPDWDGGQRALLLGIMPSTHRSAFALTSSFSRSNLSFSSLAASFCRFISALWAATRGSFSYASSMKSLTRLISSFLILWGGVGGQQMVWGGVGRQDMVWDGVGGQQMVWDGVGGQQMVW